MHRKQHYEKNLITLEDKKIRERISYVFQRDKSMQCWDRLNGTK